MLIQILSIIISPSGAAIISCLTLLIIVLLIKGAISNKTSSIKLSFAGASLETNPPQLSHHSTQESLVQTKSSAAVDPGSEGDDKSLEAKETISLLVEAIIQNDSAKVKELVEKAKSEGNENILGHPVPVAELYWPARAGDEDALERLRNFSGSGELRKSSQRLVFEVLLQDEKLADAEKYLEAMDPSLHRNLPILRSALLEKSDGVTAALNYLLSQEGKIEDEAIFEFYIECARLSKALGRNLDYQRLTEIALSIDPSASGLRFDLARSYSGNDDPNSQLHAIQHYRKRISSEYDDGSALNNLAVLYKDIDLPIKSISTFRRASAHEKVYPLANIAERFASSGFIDEAKAEILKIPETLRGEARPSEVSAYITRLENGEEDRLKKIGESIELISTTTKWSLANSKRHFRITPRSGTWLGSDKSKIEISSEQIILEKDENSKTYQART